MHAVLRSTAPLLLAAISTGQAKPTPDSDGFANTARPFLANYCVKCHGKRRPKAGLRLDTLTPAMHDPAAAERWSTVQTMVRFGEMPPQKSKKRPSHDTREAFLAWIEKELRKHGRGSHLEEKRHLPQFANFVDHQKLFDGSVDGLPFTPARIWRQRPAIYNALWAPKYGVKHRLSVKIGGRARKFTVQQGPQKGKNITTRYFRRPRFATPFFEFAHHAAGITDYASIVADQASLEALMTNAEAMAEMMTVGTSVSIQTEVKTKDSRRGNNHGGFVGGDVSTRTVRRGRIPVVFEKLMQAGTEVTDAQFSDAITLGFRMLLRRDPTRAEIARYRVDLFDKNRALGNTMALQAVLIAIAISPEFVYRMELGLGTEDAHGRRMLSPPELVHAIHYAFRDTQPFGRAEYAARDIYEDEGEPAITTMMRKERGRRAQRDAWIVGEMKAGRLKTRADVERVVRRILNEKPRNMRPNHNKGLATTTHPRVLQFFREFFGYHKAPEVFKDVEKFRRRPGFQQFQKQTAMKLVYDTDALILHVLSRDTEVLYELLTTNEICLSYFNGKHNEKQIKRQGGREKYAKRHITQTYGLDPFELEAKTTPFVVPKDQRCGVLTQPSWLIAHSGNFDNDPVRRGKWIREKLLAGYVLDVPITVQAVIPEDETKTLRERFSVVHKNECWRCHKKMNPLGMPFEQFNHVGRYRTEEKGRPVDTRGSIDFTGDRHLDGKVENVRQMMEKLARSELALQSFLRHVFRFWMGRNEELRDSKTLIAMQEAYEENDGSFREVLVALLTSDSFLYRKRSR